MRETLEQIVSLQAEYRAEATPAMQRRGLLVRRTLPDEIRALAPELQAVLGRYGNDAEAQGKDNMGQMARIPWVRWFSRSRSPSATQGWYVVYLFHPDASGVSLCLSHGSTHLDGSALVNRSDSEVAELMGWASGVVGSEFDGDRTVRRSISLGTFDLARAYERTTVFSKFYAAGRVPPDASLSADLSRFMGPLAKLYRAQELGITPGAPSADLVALREDVERITAPLKARPSGQGRGLSGPARKLVELHAMGLAREWLNEQRFEFDDVSAKESCDFRARRSGEEWVIEVKGTTGGPGSVLLTANEVALHRSRHPYNVLLIAHGIILSDDGTQVRGGELVAYSPWVLDEERLSPVCYEYRLG
jgi:hypothetical protein